MIVVWTDDRMQRRGLQDQFFVAVLLQEGREKSIIICSEAAFRDEKYFMFFWGIVKA